jgi:hypothetical protein
LAERRTALQAYARLQAEIARIRAAAGKEKQMSRRADLNLTIQRLQAEIDEHQKAIVGEAL